MTEFEKQLLADLRGTSSLELKDGSIESRNPQLGAALQSIVGNPDFKAEIGLQFQIKYYSQAVVGTPVEVAAAAIPAAQKTKLPLYLFGFNDKAGGYSAAKNTVGANGWNLTDSKIFVYGDNSNPNYAPLPHAAGSVEYAIGSIYNNVASLGDLVIVIPMNGFVAGAAATTVTAEIIVHCNNVAYGTLMNSLASDNFIINMIRYTVDSTLKSQLQNQVSVIAQSIFGKTSRDTIDPNTYITGQTFNTNIADIPLSLLMNKYIGLATPVNYDCVNFSWTITIAQIMKK